MDTTHPHPFPAPTGPAPDLTSYRGIHDALRASNRLLIAGIEALSPVDPSPRTADALRRWYAGYRAELHVHHDVEDRIFFPALADRVPAYADYADLLDADHQRLDQVIAAVGDALDALVPGPAWTEARAVAIAVAVELRDLLDRHLDVEDRDVLPMFERHFDADEYAQLDREALAGVSLRHALFTVPWYMATATPAAAAHTLATAPLALKVVERLTRRRYARLVAAAFGPARDRREVGRRR